MKRRWSLVALGACLAGAGIWHGAAEADGIPPTRPLAYSGTLEEGGQPASGTRNMKVYLWDDVASTDSAHRKCQTDAPATVITAGRFSIELDATCLEVVKANPTLWVEVEVAGQALGRTPLKAVPYAVEAARASQASTLAASADVPPAGTAIAFTGTSCPEGYLYADNAAVSRVTYSRLFAAIGTTWGQGDGSTTFNLPDLRGAFLRGDGTQTYSAVTYSGSSVGVRQGDAFQGHFHAATPARVGTEQVILGGGGTFGSGPNYIAGTELGVTSPVSDSVNGSPRIGVETRPFNVSVKYCVRY